MKHCLHIIETTLQTGADAEKIACLLVEEALAVCARVDAGCRSWYRWQGGVSQEAEVALHLKVRDDRLVACRERLRGVHPYEIPMILIWPVAWADPDYLDWAYGEDGA